VNAPRQPRIGPALVVLMMGLLPALGLWAIWQWADTQARIDHAQPETSQPDTSQPDTSQPDTGQPDTGVDLMPSAPPAPVLSTPFFSMRRTPLALAHELNLEVFKSEIAPLLATINDRSCVVISVDGNLVGQRNATLPVLPASVQKIMVAAAALEILGEEFRYRTRVLGSLTSDGVVAGDLYLVGGGDPLLSGDWYPVSNLERFPVFNHTSMDQLADAIVEAGVTRVTGNLVGDGSRYDDEFYAPGWGVGVAGTESGPYSALTVNDARVLGDNLRASDPNEAAVRELRRLLAERGVRISGGAVSGTAPATTPEVAGIDSVPLPGVLAQMLTNSDNNSAEMIVKELGVAAQGLGTRPAGLQAMRNVFQSWGVNLDGVVLADGSGLSLDNRLTCEAVSAVLRRLEVDGHVGAGLPVAGNSGTLAGAFAGDPVSGSLRGKTGTLNNPPFNQDPPAVKALAGYLPVDGGGAIEFVLLLNGPTISDQSEYRPIWNLLAQVISTYPAGAGPDLLGPR
jgi:D-alanyl-D-alanine carboxypeptidase/D-alanyl-D-alanine-endopeptidase (penicillin-binding protein 4)